MGSLAGRELSLATQKEPVQLGINRGWAGYLCHLIFSLPVSLSPSLPCQGRPNHSSQRPKPSGVLEQETCGKQVKYGHWDADKGGVGEHRKDGQSTSVGFNLGFKE